MLRCLCPSRCENCSAATSSETRCSCGGEHLCEDLGCSKCIPRPRCKRGEQLKRSGKYDFSYYCEPCPNATFNNVTDGVCVPILDCRKFGFSTLFPGNKTHDARCVCPKDKYDDLIHVVMGICLAITSLICVVLFINICIRKAMYKKRKNKHHLIHPNECSCKLSKEEIGENHDINENHVSDIFLEVSTKTS
ncbi:tumor necrosis factor receptor superfamily member 18 isoform X2 [Brachyhypopomus gauderio]|uniref:tumor necrosis factor receptor superfamily member 18 isoform X2 n=1 Tax=Brachyhypopomus gauderio TaxID=698409 RepID=UPI004042E10E